MNINKNANQTPDTDKKENNNPELTALNLNDIDNRKKNTKNGFFSDLKTNKKKLALVIAATVAVLILIVVIIFAVTEKNEPAPQPATSTTPVPSPSPTPQSTPTPEAVVIPIDFATYQAQNPDVYAWIQIPDTNINYPILQHPTDNYYYLSHTIDHQEKTEGSIYTETFNSKDWTDSNTIIYGHNMRNGSMFKHVHKFKDLEFFNTHRTIYIYTPTQILEYRTFALYTTDSRHLHYTYNFADPNVFSTYLTEIFAGRSSLMQGGNLDTSINLNSANKIITLQTCTGNDNTRLLLQAVLVKVSGTPDIVIPDTVCVTGEAVSK